MAPSASPHQTSLPQRQIYRQVSVDCQANESIRILVHKTVEQAAAAPKKYTGSASGKATRFQSIQPPYNRPKQSDQVILPIFTETMFILAY
jgi:autonomous glycyl radical cofactor GrcA